ncbi:MAG: hypothetical protein KF833_22335 [Verrucomicrobiae bacterium]|nr:hypothetical protein [Verrucomicrobiae bacterium]
MNSIDPSHRRTFTALTALACALAATLHAPAATPSVLPQYDTYLAGEDIVVAFADGPGNPKDWIGVYPIEVVPGSVPSTLWRYVDGTGSGGGHLGLHEGSITFPNGLSLAGDWTVFLLLNDGYTELAHHTLSVVDPATTLVRSSRRTYGVGEPIEISFLNGWGTPTDWVGLYREGQTPGPGTPATLWFYVGGTRTATEGLTDGTLDFPTGLTSPGEYVAHFLYNDSYEILASAPFSVVAAPPPSTPRLLSLQPANGSSGLPPLLSFAASITNGISRIVPASVTLQLNGVTVPATVTPDGELLTVTYRADTLPAPGSTHTWILAASDDATPTNPLRAESTITIAAYRNIVLPAPLYFEDFDTVAEGSLPAGWTDQSHTMPLNDTFDFGDLGSLAYARWTVVNADRFLEPLATYGNPEALSTDYRRVLSVNPLNVLNGAVYDQPLASGRFLFGNSGYQNGAGSQVLTLFTPDFDLSGRSHVHLAFKSLWEQNQDSLAAIEYSVDRGASWLPIAYWLDGSDIVRVTDEATGITRIDVDATFLTERSDIARYVDDFGVEVGGYYGAFIAAPLTPALAPHIEARIDDNPVESKRIELFRLPAADNQPAVRFRFVHAGTDSWYFGIDDLGLYSIDPDQGGEPPVLALSRQGNELVLSWSAPDGWTLQSTPSLTAPAWQPVPGATGNSHPVDPTAAAAFYRLTR